LEAPQKAPLLLAKDFASSHDHYEISRPFRTWLPLGGGSFLRGFAGRAHSHSRPRRCPWRSYGWHWSGRPPKDKRVVEDENSRAEVWWGPVNIPIEPNTLVVSRERARGYLNTRDRLYCVDELRVGIRSIASMCASSVHGHNIVFQWGRLIPAYCKLCD